MQHPQFREWRVAALVHTDSRRHLLLTQKTHGNLVAGTHERRSRTLRGAIDAVLRAQDTRSAETEEERQRVWKAWRTGLVGEHWPTKKTLERGGRNR